MIGVLGGLSLILVVGASVALGYGAGLRKAQVRANYAYRVGYQRALRELREQRGER